MRNAVISVLFLNVYNVNKICSAHHSQRSYRTNISSCRPMKMRKVDKAFSPLHHHSCGCIFTGGCVFTDPFENNSSNREILL